MTSPSEERDEPEGITDDQLPEDLQPEENPLDEGLDQGERAGDLLEEGRKPEQSEGEESSEVEESGQDEDED